MKQLLSQTIHSATAVTFVDVLAIIRGIRAKGQACIQYQAELLALLEHPKITRHAQEIIEQALGSELKKAARQRQRSTRTITSQDRGKTVRMPQTETLKIELKAQHGFYWEAEPSSSGIQIQGVIGAQAKPGYDTFTCRALNPGTQRVHFSLKADARLSKKHSLRTPATHEFYFDLTVES